MPIDFPNSPSNGDTYTVGNNTWQFDGTVWASVYGQALIGTGAVTEEKLATGAVTATKIGSGAITEAKIAANAVTQAKLASSISAVTVCTSSTKPGSPFDGQTIYMTDVDQTAVWDGSTWVGVERTKDRNLIINGAMQIAQRGTSTTSITTIGYFTADRWAGGSSGAGTWTNSVVADAPAGTGFINSYKWTCTTAQASLGTSAYAIAYQAIEGQNAQTLSYGSASAKIST